LGYLADKKGRGTSLKRTSGQAMSAGQDSESTALALQKRSEAKAKRVSIESVYKVFSFFILESSDTKVYES